MFKKLIVATAIAGLSSLALAQGAGAPKHAGSATPATPATPAVHATPATPAVAATPATPASPAAHDDMAAKPKAKQHKKAKRQHKK
ncbi:hypothetical protein [Denitratisoma oestradiolicum]|uniref:Uncharacterized protein n=1 Tax=Denitratisoma oestradiolicum TaxID=311182 RepID=A0A6S6XZ77_9PROT|nr:hypothetical protein [Denitratisoma oestradiolicum]TWO79305.1 hypothetical protein CBW56_15465 [Denitratisoma oestradiolicum]CAB1370368.1 conserved exported protein of unknown function [Denitratisoma oestradiolicum]